MCKPFLGKVVLDDVRFDQPHGRSVPFDPKKASRQKFTHI